MTTMIILSISCVNLFRKDLRAKHRDRSYEEEEQELIRGHN